MLSQYSNNTIDILMFLIIFSVALFAPTEAYCAIKVFIQVSIFTSIWHSCKLQMDTVVLYTYTCFYW